ncbi:AraC family transcriptional regulator [Acetobacter fallax]|uniref:Helix-turn-helix domain-containing protein n=1 Tax=Acetobacter fallax TaxID=1737473 RepID=A0ABX0KFE2_9PROT|nr:AraC family transcriptional regulator [Acetobacter fallax]NHO33843.1 helix-turn-helix domain-containing protein [Acetobacter fallax]NHO37403.1 helix-turn-helix domain-containing protein [Acetobacter fallax]
MKRTADLPRNPPPVVGFADCYVGGLVDRFHTHDRAQLSVFLSGSVTINTQDESFVLRPGQGLWLPANTLHEATCRTDLMFQVIYVDSCLTSADNLSCKMFDASFLIRGLVDEIIAMRFSFVMDDRMSVIARLLVDEIGRAPRIADRLLFPSDHRLRRVCEAIIARPGNRHDIDYWATQAGMARRTFTRLFQVEMGMGFAAWRRRVRVVEGAARIAAGQSIAEVAFDLGYDNAASFSTMFHRTFGVAPRTLRSGSSSTSRP